MSVSASLPPTYDLKLNDEMICTYPVKLRNRRGHINHTTNKLHHYKWTIHSARFQEETEKFTESSHNSNCKCEILLLYFKRTLWLNGENKLNHEEISCHFDFYQVTPIFVENDETFWRMLDGINTRRWPAFEMHHLL